MSETSSVQHLLGFNPSSEKISDYLTLLASQVSEAEGATTPEVKSYSDAVYLNYYRLGLSLLFTPTRGYRPKAGFARSDLRDEDLILDGIDIYNTTPSKDVSSSSPKPPHVSNPPFAPYPALPLAIPISEEPKDDGNPRSSPLEVSATMTGKDFVTALGEPDRKGGGSGPSSGNIAIWLEWSRDGLMVEFGGEESRGPKAWETAKDAIWSVVSIFPPKEQV